jgi:hypothetical protein
MISSEEDGLVFFDGGTYSRGPSSLLTDEDFPDGGGDLLQADKDRLERQLSLEVHPFYYTNLVFRFSKVLYQS